jgi:hypothetical protein
MANIHVLQPQKLIQSHCTGLRFCADTVLYPALPTMSDNTHLTSQVQHCAKVRNVIVLDTRINYGTEMQHITLYTWNKAGSKLYWDFFVKIIWVCW